MVRVNKEKKLSKKDNEKLNEIESRLQSSLNFMYEYFVTSTTDASIFKNIILPKKEDSDEDNNNTG